LLVPVLLALAVLAPTSFADSGGATLVVSTFDGDVPAAPGTTLIRTVRVTHRGVEPLAVDITPHRVELLDDGQTRFTHTPDPLWSTH
jgi:hypothetical protein